MSILLTPRLLTVSEEFQCPGETPSLIPNLTLELVSTIRKVTLDAGV